MSNLCNAAACAKVALDKVVCEAVTASALDFYVKIVEFLRNTICFDLTLFFQLIALLVIICWIQNWFIEIMHFICKIPKVLKNLFCGKFNLCLLNCEGSESSCKSKSKSKSKSDESENY